MAVVLDFQAALKAKQNKRQVEPVEHIQDDKSQFFYPEMGEVVNPTKMIRASNGYKGVVLEWADDSNSAVRALFKKHRVRPLKRNAENQNIEHYPYGDARVYWNNPPFGLSGYYSCSVSWDAYKKLSAEGVCAYEALLD